MQTRACLAVRSCPKRACKPGLQTRQKPAPEANLQPTIIIVQLLHPALDLLKELLEAYACQLAALGLCELIVATGAAGGSRCAAHPRAEVRWA